MPEVPAVRAAEQPLIDVYQQAWSRIDAMQRALVDDPLNARKKARLREMQRTVESVMRALDGQTHSWIESELPGVYAVGGGAGASTMGAEFTWSMISQQAVEQLAGTMFQDLLEATSFMEQSTKGLIRKIGQDVALSKAIEGKTAVQAGREMARLLSSDGIAAVVYKNGARHGLGEYAEMAIRTTTAKAYNFGTLNGAAGAGCVYWEVFDGPECGWSAHDAGEQAAGKIVTRDEAMEFPISHPNCRRAFGPRPDLTSTAKASEGKGSVTPEQVAAQRAQDAERQALQERRALRNRQTSERRAARSPASRVEKRASRLRERTGTAAAESPAAPALAPAPRNPLLPTGGAQELKPSGVRGVPTQPILTEAEKRLTYDYAWDYSTYNEVNGALRAQDITDKRPAWLVKRDGPEGFRTADKIDDITRMIDGHTLDTDTTVYRTLAMDDRSMFKEFKAGEVFEERGFMSSALDKEITEGFDVGDYAVNLRIQAPAGTRALNIGDSLMDMLGSFDQTEVLFQRGSIFRVTKVTRNGRSLDVEMTLERQRRWAY